jgi:[FeFe] hydrogenase H-cluster maturation GTPase HydF
MSVLVERDNIGIFGKMNAGKSSVMNLLTQQETSIVDATPGTTADTKITLQEIHGMGPAKLFDTAGVNELNELGSKKRKKVIDNLKESDLALLVIDPSTTSFEGEKELLHLIRKEDKQALIIYNLFNPTDEQYIPKVEEKLSALKLFKKITLSANESQHRSALLNFILSNYESKNQQFDLIPFLKKNEFYILIIPMDEETPPGRYLRPQAMTEEYITRHWGYPVSFRLDLGKARSQTPVIAEQEKQRFNSFLNQFTKRPEAVITDSQAMDIMHYWVPQDIKLTTFSITMINYFSRGRLQEFADGINALQHIQSGDKILIVEACNHSRTGEDIGTVQIPNFFKKNLPGVEIDYNFGREFQENEQLESYKLIIHCGGCMISAQKLLVRIKQLEALGIPFTNYGIFLSYMQGKDALERVLEPWNHNERNNNT